MTRFLLMVAVSIAGELPPAVASEATDQRSRTDLHDDPLPKGAIARLATQRLRGCLGPIVFSPDGKHVVAAGDDGTQAANNRTDPPAFSFVWDAATGRLLRRFPDDLPKGETALLSTATNGRIITTRSDDHTLRLRDLATGKEVRPLKTDGDFGDPMDVSAVTADGRWAALHDAIGVGIFDLTSGSLRCFFIPERFSPNLPVGLSITADGSILAVEIQEQKQPPWPPLLAFFRRYYDAKTGRQVAADKFAPDWLQAERIWPSTSSMLASIRQRKLLNRDEKPAFEEITDTRNWKSIHGVHESPGGRYLAVFGATGRPFKGGQRKDWLRLWDSATRRLVMELDAKAIGNQRIAGFSPDARTFVSTTYPTATIHLWESATGRERLRLVGHGPGDVTVAFRPDGRVLVSGGADTQAFLWDVTGRSPDGVRRQTQHSPERQRQLWDDLARDDAAKAYGAMWSLVDAPTQTVAWMREHLPAAVPAEPRQLSRLIADLDSDEFIVRSKASEELERLGELAEPALRAELRAKPTLECRRRCDELLAKLSVLSSRRLRAVRAVEVLEHIGTAEARTLLEKLRRGAPQARLTQEARAARERLLDAPR